VASTPGAQPPGFPASLIGGTERMPWTADTASPVIHLSWHGQRRIASLIVRPAAGQPSRPQTVKVTSPDGTRQASIGAGGLARFAAPLTTNRIDVSFPRVRQSTIVTATGQVATVPVRLSRLSVPALNGLRAVTPDQQARFTRPCGQGPVLTVDGRVYQTSVSGTLGELSQYLPLQVRLCAPGGALRLGAGRHTLTTAPGTFAVTDLSLADQGPAAAPGAARAVTIGSWQPDQGRLSIGPGAASYLEVHENYNPGWAATLNGHRLTTVRLDGWQQGFIVPAGPGGTMTLSFLPTGTYHLALAMSLLFAAALLVLAAWSFTGRRRRTGRDEGSGLAGWPPPGTDDGTPAAGGRRAWLGVLGVTVLVVVAGGAMAVAVPVLAWLSWRAASRPWLSWVAFGGMIASGALSAAQPFGTGLLGPFGGPAQACALVALAAALTPAVNFPAWRRAATTEGEADR
jgi:arabinofuranan 3-O-arabinosyltransferase